MENNVWFFSIKIYFIAAFKTLHWTPKDSNYTRAKPSENIHKGLSDYTSSDTQQISSLLPEWKKNKVWQTWADFSYYSPGPSIIVSVSIIELSEFTGKYTVSKTQDTHLSLHVPFDTLLWLNTLKSSPILIMCQRMC